MLLGTKTARCLWCGKSCGEKSKCLSETRSNCVKETKFELINKGPPMEIGVFVAPSKSGQANTLKKGQTLGEFIGELLPGSTPPERLSAYAFTWDARKPTATNVIDPGTRGNVWRFCNHSCKPNVEVESAVLSGRQVLLLTAMRDISEGEELYISYGHGYFVDRGMMCACDWKPTPHVPKR